jgi:hypothetical protein
MSKTSQDNLKTGTPTWELIKPSWHLLIKNYEQVAFFFFLPGLIFILGSFYFSKAHLSLYHFLHHPKYSFNLITGLVLIFVWLIISIVNYAPSLYFRIEAVKQSGNAPSVFDCYKAAFKYIGRAWLSEILTVISISIGLLALIIPGVIFFRSYILTPYYAVDNPKLTIKELFKQSRGQSVLFSKYIYTTYLMIWFYNLIGVILFGSFSLGSIGVELISYVVLFLPALRYMDIRTSSKRS